MFHGILQEHLKRERRDAAVEDAWWDVDFDVQLMLEPDPQEIIIRLYELEFFAKRHPFLVLGGEYILVRLRESADELLRRLHIFEHEGRDCVQTVEQVVGAYLAF